MLLGDMAVCVAAGRSWLQREVIQSPVLWIDFDNGQRRTHERFAALARARSLPDNTPLSYVSMPQPWLNAESPEDIEKLMNRIVKNNIKLVCIDNLGLISMGAEEKSDAMIPIMANLRLLSEQTGAAVSVIHHQRKGTSVNSRAGDSLRGHSGIEGAIDLALLVTREECGNWITIQSTKTRDVEVLPFMAEFRYDHKIGSNELQTASFVKIELEDRTSDAAIEKALIDICNENPVITQKKAVALAKKDLDVGINRIRHVYKQLKNSNRITSYNVVEDD
jgi:RecA-family ATPase